MSGPGRVHSRLGANPRVRIGGVAAGCVVGSPLSLSMVGWGVRRLPPLASTLRPSLLSGLSVSVPTTLAARISGGPDTYLVSEK